MRADMPANPSGPKTGAADFLKSTRPNDYAVAPIYVHDLVTQCAAHFLAWFVGMSPENVRDVVDCGREPGGLKDEVDWFFSQCTQDIDDPENALGYWPIEENGPWVYDGIDPLDVADVVRAHTDGWSDEEFLFYGYTVEEKANLMTAAAQFKAAIETMPG